MAVKPPTPQGISALLRKAGFARAEVSAIRIPRSGYLVRRRAIDAVEVEHRTALSGQHRARLAMLAKYEAALTAKGWAVRYPPHDSVLVVTAPESTEGETR